MLDQFGLNVFILYLFIPFFHFILRHIRPILYPLLVCSACSDILQCFMFGQCQLYIFPLLILFFFFRFHHFFSFLLASSFYADPSHGSICSGHPVAPPTVIFFN